MKNLFKFIYPLGLSLILALSFSSCSDDDDKSSEALILEMTFDNPIVTQQPVIDGTNIRFSISSNTTNEELKELIPTIKISPKASINPASGSKVDFSGNPVEFTVIAEDGTTQVYTVTCQVIGKYDFEEWVKGIEDQKPEYTFYHPVGGWSSSNMGVYYLKAFAFLLGINIDGFAVTQTDEAHGGKSAAKIETLLTNKIDGTGKALAPVVTTGSLFLGAFETDLENTLNSTKFGITYDKKPLTVKGYYKYTPGVEFLRCPDPKSYNKVNVEVGTKDECVINAILYEISSEDDPYITGIDTYNEDKLTAIAKLQDGTAKANYTAFSIDMKYLKTYDPTKKYRFAIICSSSKYGDTFSGAPGSVLYVDDIEVVSE